MPRLQMSSAALGCPFQWFEPETDGLGAFYVHADHVGGQADLHPEANVLGVRRHIDQVGPHARPAAVDHGGHEGDRDPGGSQRHDAEGPHLAGRGDLGIVERPAPAGRAGVAVVEETGPAAVALVSDETWLGVKDQVVD